MSTAQDKVNALEERLPFWLGDLFWDRLNRLEARHLRIQSQHDAARRGLEAVQRKSSPEVLDAWRRYCDVIAELDRTTAELESLRTHPE
jgi:hypothetical protein